VRLGDDDAERRAGRQIGQRHQAVHDVGERPHEIELGNGPENDEDAKHATVPGDSALADQILERLLAVVAPAQQGCVREENNRWRRRLHRSFRADRREAAAVSCAPVRPLCQVPVVRITIPVNEHTTMVSMKVCVIDTMACATDSACAAAAAIGELPRPDSFENTPRATPSGPRRAPRHRRSRRRGDGGECVLKDESEGRQDAVDVQREDDRGCAHVDTIITGTSTLAARPMLWIPPRMTMAVAAAMTSPLRRGGTPNSPAPHRRRSSTAPCCDAEAAIEANTANSVPSHG